MQRHIATPKHLKSFQKRNQRGLGNRLYLKEA